MFSSDALAAGGSPWDASERASSVGHAEMPDSEMQRVDGEDDLGHGQHMHVRGLHTGGAIHTSAVGPMRRESVAAEREDDNIHTPRGRHEDQEQSIQGQLNTVRVGTRGTLDDEQEDDDLEDQDKEDHVYDDDQDGKYSLDDEDDEDGQGDQDDEDDEDDHDGQDYQDDQDGENQEDDAVEDDTIRLASLRANARLSSNFILSYLSCLF